MVRHVTAATEWLISRLHRDCRGGGWRRLGDQRQKQGKQVRWDQAGGSEFMVGASGRTPLPSIPMILHEPGHRSKPVTCKGAACRAPTGQPDRQRVSSSRQPGKQRWCLWMRVVVVFGPRLEAKASGVIFPDFHRGHHYEAREAGRPWRCSARDGAKRGDLKRSDLTPAGTPSLVEELTDYSASRPWLQKTLATSGHRSRKIRRI